MRLRQLILGGLLLAALAGAGLWARDCLEQRRQVVFVIPAGTSAQVAAGGEVSVLPATIELERNLRDTLVIRNEDTEALQIGPYLIAPGQQFVQRYPNRGTFDLICTIHESQRMRVVVR
jgi:hypothetical protein